MKNINDIRNINRFSDRIVKSISYDDLIKSGFPTKLLSEEIELLNNCLDSDMRGTYKLNFDSDIVKQTKARLFTNYIKNTELN